MKKNDFNGHKKMTGDKKFITIVYGIFLLLGLEANAQDLIINGSMLKAAGGDNDVLVDGWRKQPTSTFSWLMTQTLSDSSSKKKTVGVSKHELPEFQQKVGNSVDKSEVQSFFKKAQKRQFLENVGQIKGEDSDKVRFVVNQPKIDVFILENGIVYQYKKVNSGGEGKSKEKTIDSYRMDAQLIGANLNSAIIKEGGSKDFTSQYTSSGDFKYHGYEKITFKNVYPKIDWRLFFRDGNLEYEFVVHPGGNPKDIRLKYKYHEGLSMLADGSIKLKSRLGDVIENKPISFQAGKEVPTEYALKEDEMGFVVKDYNLNETLLIDPILTLDWGTYYGDDYTFIQEIEYVNEDEIYISGYTGSESGSYILAGGFTYGLSYNGAHFLAKFKSDGTRLWGLMYGAANDESGASYGGGSVAVDNNGYVYLYANTDSDGLSTSGSFQPNNKHGFGEGILVKFNSNGIRQWATYYGTTSAETPGGVEVDTSNNVYITTLVEANGLGYGSNVHQNSFAGGSYDVVLTKFNSSGTRQWATYIGGSGDENSGTWITKNLHVDANHAYVFGSTKSTSGIATSGSFIDTFPSGSSSKGFIIKINNSNGSRAWGTYVGSGGSLTDSRGSLSGYGDYLYLATSISAGTTSLATPGTHQENVAGDSDVVMLKLRKSDSQRIWGTYFGGDLKENRIASDANEDYVYISGSTRSTSGISDSGSWIENHPDTSYAGFIAVFNTSDGTKIDSTYYGNAEDDLARDIASGITNDVMYLVGGTESQSNIATPGSLYDTYAPLGTGKPHGMLMKFNVEEAPDCNLEAILGFRALNANGTCPPVISAPNNGDAYTLAVPENTTVVTDVNSNDKEDGTETNLIYSLSGDDATLFGIDMGGNLSFNTAPDYESPADTGTDNSYNLAVTVTDSDGLTDTQDITVNVIDDDEIPTVALQVKAILQGAYDTNANLMRDDLRSKSLIPVNQPYQDAVTMFDYAGSETAAASVLATEGNDAAVDWVLVELRAADRVTRVAALAGLIQRDGDVMDAQTGDTILRFSNVVAGDYHIVLNHRNHLGVITQNAIALSPDTTVVDYSDVATSVYGENARLEMDGIALLWAGEANRSNTVIANGPGNDLTLLFATVLSAAANQSLLNGNYRYAGYHQSDFNLDGMAIFAGPDNDANLVMANVLIHPGNDTVSANYVVRGTVPKPGQ